MEAVRETRKMNTLAFRVPAGSQTTFLRTMAKNMGWEAVPQPRKRKLSTSQAYPVDYDFNPNATTIRAMREGREGKVFQAASAEDLIHQILG